MNLYLYLDGEIVPAVYDYDLDLDGVLIDTKRQTARGRDICMIVLKRGDQVPTKAQQKTLNTIKTINPNWTIKYFFQRPR